MDIIRRTNNDNFTYYDRKTHRKILDSNTLKRIQSLRIPPAYTNVKISKRANTKVQAIGTDTKKRKQYIYNKEYVEMQKEIKFEDLIHFGRKIKRIRKDILTNIKSCSKDNSKIHDKTCIISLILFLIDRCNFRVGNERYKKLYNSYGATTLNKSHFTINKNNVVIKFNGKKGVSNQSKVDNKVVKNLIENLCRFESEYIFCYNDSKGDTYRVTEKHINDYLKKYHKSLSVKMFRTWSANYMLLRSILDHPLPENNKEANKNIRSIIKTAAGKMHHTGHVSKKSYMNNKLIDLYLENPIKFKGIIEQFRKGNGSFPTINRMLNLFLKYLCNK
jgi:DNA topoisomerase I